MVRVIRSWAGPLFVLFLLMLSPTRLMAANPCAELDEAQDNSYRGLVQLGTEQATAKSYEEAIASFEAAQAICPFDPAVTYSLARLHQLNGDCKTATTLYRQAEAQLSGGLIETSLTVEMIVEKLAEAETECKNRASLAIACTDAGVSLWLDGEPLQGCPWEGPVAPGPHAIKVELVEHLPYETMVDIEAGDSLQVLVPALTPDQGGLAQLEVSCTDQGAEVLVAGERHPCPATLSLPPGNASITVSKDGHQDYADQIFLVEGGHAKIVVPRLEAEAGPGALEVHCPEGVDAFVLSGPEGVQNLSCPHSADAEPGIYLATIKSLGITEQFAVRSGALAKISLEAPERSNGGEKKGEDGVSNSGDGLLFGLGVVVAGSGVIAHFVAEEYLREEIRTSDTMTQKEAKEAQDQADLVDTLGIVGMSVGGAMVLGGIIWMLVDEEGEAPAQAMITPNGVALQVLW